MSHLFNQRRSGELKGLLLPYLGMTDKSLQEDPKIGTLPEDFVTRSEVMGLSYGLPCYEREKSRPSFKTR